MKRWLAETHGATFELLRHFLLRFFESELITAPGEMLPVLIGILPVFFQWFFIVIPPLHHKYAYLAQLPVPGPYREAVRADQLWLIALVMSAIGLLTAIKWQTLFPSLRDCQVLGSLPLRARQIFLAKLMALVIVAAAALFVVNFLPCLGFPSISQTRWSLQPSAGRSVLAHAVASLAGCAFFVFGLAALQGVLLNLLPPRAFGRLTGYLQGALVGLMLCLAVVSFSIEPRITAAAVRPEWGAWLPPVWFLGVCRTILGDPDPAMHAYGRIGWIALGAALALTLLTYAVSYHRHRALMVEGPSRRAGKDRLGNLLASILSREPRQQAIFSFMLRTLARGNHHRMILMGYAGLAIALLATGILAMDSVVGAARASAADFVYYHLIALLFLVAGARQLFAVPTELKANWIFQITEREGRVEWLGAMDRFVLIFGFVPLMLIPLPLEFHMLGLRAIPEAAILAAVGLLAYEWTFSSWNKLPFTCSQLPGKTPVWLVLAFFGLFGVLSIVHNLLLAALDNLFGYALLSAMVAVAVIKIHRARMEHQAEVPLKYEELPESPVQALTLR